MSMYTLALFEKYRASLIGLAYRITGSISEAEDITQDAFLKWNAADHASIQSPHAWLMKVVTRLSLDYLKSTKHKRESYVGPWLPEPYLADADTPADQHELDETITMALLVLLDRLSPAERASFILHDLFHFQFSEISHILDIKAASCRKLASRARVKIAQSSFSDNVSKAEHDKIVTAFFAAIKNGDVSQLVALLKDNVALHADGGGKAVAALQIIEGLDAVVNFLLKYVAPAYKAIAKSEKMSLRYVWFNGSDGFIIQAAKRTISAFNFLIIDNKIKTIHVLRNPDKLKYFEN